MVLGLGIVWTSCRLRIGDAVTWTQRTNPNGWVATPHLDRGSEKEKDEHRTQSQTKPTETSKIKVLRYHKSKEQISNGRNIGNLRPRKTRHLRERQTIGKMKESKSPQVKLLQEGLKFRSGSGVVKPSASISDVGK